MSIVDRFMRGVAKRVIQEMNPTLKKAFDAIKEEMDDHKQSINENSNEIAANYEFLMRLDTKMDKLAERIDAISMAQNNIPEAQIKLGKSEQKIFMALYMSHEPLSVHVLAEGLKLNEVQVRDCISHMIDRGIAIVQDYSKRVQCVRLGQEFRELHAKNNVVKIETKAHLEMPATISA